MRRFLAHLSWLFEDPEYMTWTMLPFIAAYFYILVAGLAACLGYFS